MRHIHYFLTLAVTSAIAGCQSASAPPVVQQRPLNENVVVSTSPGAEPEIGVPAPTPPVPGVISGTLAPLDSVGPVNGMVVDSPPPTAPPQGAPPAEAATAQGSGGVPVPGAMGQPTQPGDYSATTESMRPPIPVYPTTDPTTEAYAPQTQTVYVEPQAAAQPVYYPAYVGGYYAPYYGSPYYGYGWGGWPYYGWGWAGCGGWGWGVGFGWAGFGFGFSWNSGNNCNWNHWNGCNSGQWNHVSTGVVAKVPGTLPPAVAGGPRAPQVASAHQLGAPAAAMPLPKHVTLNTNTPAASAARGASLAKTSTPVAGNTLAAAARSNGNASRLPSGGITKLVNPKALPPAPKAQLLAPAVASSNYRTAGHELAQRPTPSSGAQEAAATGAPKVGSPQITPAANGRPPVAPNPQAKLPTFGAPSPAGAQHTASAAGNSQGTAPRPTSVHVTPPETMRPPVSVHSAPANSVSMRAAPSMPSGHVQAPVAMHSMPNAGMQSAPSMHVAAPSAPSMGGGGGGGGGHMSGAPSSVMSMGGMGMGGGGGGGHGGRE